MADFPRTIIPARVSAFELPGSFKIWGRSGKVQTRTLGASGRSWEELFPAMDVEAQATKEFLAIINNYLRSGETFTIAHRDYLTPNGAGGGTPKVAGGSQTGSTIDTDGWPNNTLVLKAGDLFTMVGVADAKDMLADATSDGGGAATLSFGPPILSGGSPGNNADLTITNVKMTCILDDVILPRSGPTRAQSGLKLVFRESL